VAEAVVTPDAELGARDVIVTNPGGAQGIGTGLLTIVEPAAEEEEPPAAEPAAPTEDGDEGCGCRMGRPASSPPSGAAVLALLALAWQRRRRTPRA
jgi:MYXO-CTERM domain-containing protein